MVGVPSKRVEQRKRNKLNINESLITARYWKLKRLENFIKGVIVDESRSTYEELRRRPPLNAGCS